MAKSVLVVWSLLLVLVANSFAAAVAVHDPSIVIVYKDASGNSYPENDAAKTRTKYYYVFGTQMGAAYSKDMIDWTSFTPTFSVNGTVTTDYTKSFSVASAWSGHATSADVLGNLWAPDIIYNKALKKWTLYFSQAGDLWKSVIVMHTADKIEGPYTYAGAVVYSGMTNKTTGTGNDDYKKVMGTSTVAARYLDGSSNWTGTYGSSCIDPAVSYDEQGRLWMSYGSWSGGIFLIKLDEATGLRDYGYNYGFTKDTVMNGTTLRYDKYMGIHIGGGYYVSGEGSYIRYLKDPSGTGYYYLFVSMGFYSPEGGYTMRVFRSSTIDGTYTDVTGDNAAFSKYIFNYGTNVTYGFPIMQNYKWSWWSKGEVAQGHNSVLRDEDGSGYLVYHRKFDDGAIFHNVETHQLVYNKQGWILAAPFEYRVGYGMRSKPFSVDEIAGAYGVIAHKPVDYANLASNQESEMLLKADGTVSGAYTGTWSYEAASGRNYLTLVTSAGTFNGVVLEQLMNDNSARTVSFTSMNPSGELALWGYRKPKTSQTRTTDFVQNPKLVGAADFSLLWSDTAKFHGVDVSGDFTVEFTFDETSRAQENWDNWALVFRNGTQSWHLRGDAFSLSTITGTTVTHKTDWNGAIDFKKAYNGRKVRLLSRKTGTVIDVFAFADSVLVATATATGCPAGSYRVQLGGEAVSMSLTKASASTIADRERVGAVSDFGTYTNAFNVLHSTTTSVSGDFKLAYRFANYRTSTNSDNWTNYLVRSAHDNTTSFLRSDAYAMDMTGAVAYTYDWTWAQFASIMQNADVQMTISRTGSTILYDAVISARQGGTYHYTATNTQATTSPIVFDLTSELGMVDLFQVENITSVPPAVVSGLGGAVHPVAGYRAYAKEGRLILQAEGSGTVRIQAADGKLVRVVNYSPGTNVVEALGKGVYFVDRKPLAIY